MTRHVIIARNTAAGKWVLQIENLKEKSARRSSDWHGGSTTCRKTNLKGRTIATDTFHQKIKNDGDMLLLFLFRFLRFLTELSLWFVDRVSRNWTFRYRSVDWILQRLFQKVSDIGIAKKKREKKNRAKLVTVIYFCFMYISLNAWRVWRYFFHIFCLAALWHNSKKLDFRVVSRKMLQRPLSITSYLILIISTLNIDEVLEFFESLSFNCKYFELILARLVAARKSHSTARSWLPRLLAPKRVPQSVRRMVLLYLKLKQIYYYYILLLLMWIFFKRLQRKTVLLIININ